MTTIAAVGPNEFTLGFGLAGIKKIYEVTPATLMATIKELRGNPQISVVVIDESMLSTLDRHERADIEGSVRPVFVGLSTKSTQDNLRFLIKKSIGVDLLAQ